MSRKKSEGIVIKIIKSTFIGLWWIVKTIFKAIFWLIIKLLELISPLHDMLYNWIHSEPNVKQEKVYSAQHKVHKSSLNVPAVYNPIVAETTVKGSIDGFTQHLEKESRIIAIAGRRGSGKSGLGFRLMENINASVQRPCFVIGVKQAVLPMWITTIEDINQVENQGIVLVDEGAISFGARNSMSKKNKGLAELLAVARHKDLTLIFITQNTGMIDKNVLNLCDTIMLKEGSLLQEKMERSVMKDLYTTANKAIAQTALEDRKSFFYVFDAEFEGLAKASLPSFWSISVSKNQA